MKEQEYYGVSMPWLRKYINLGGFNSRLSRVYAGTLNVDLPKEILSQLEPFSILRGLGGVHYYKSRNEHINPHWRPLDSFGPFVEEPAPDWDEHMVLEKLFGRNCANNLHGEVPQESRDRLMSSFLAPYKEVPITIYYDERKDPKNKVYMQGIMKYLEERR